LTERNPLLVNVARPPLLAALRETTVRGNRIREAKAAGLANLPHDGYHANAPFSKSS
jgi:hypothetical protein